MQNIAATRRESSGTRVQIPYSPMKYIDRIAGQLLTEAGHDIMPVYAYGEFWYWLNRATGDPIAQPVFGPPKPPHIHQHEVADACDCFSKCYFIGGDTGFIKIGHSVDPIGRLATIQAHSPIAVRLLALRQGGKEREAAYHSQFAEYRRHGEWFERAPKILAEIERFKA